MFAKGENYTRQQIAAKLGGSIQDCLPHKDGRVVAICMKPEMNPHAPSTLLARRGRDRERWSDHLCSQQKDEAIPVFVKIENKAWKFEGSFKVVKCSRNVTDRDVYIVIHLEEADID